MLLPTLYLTMALTLAPPAEAQPVSDVFVENCRVVSIEDQEIPGVEAGALAVLEVKEGMSVKKDHVLGRMYTRDVEAQKKVKQYDYDIAAEKAKSDVNIRYATAAAAVAKEAWNKVKKANEGSRNTVADIEVMKLKLEYEKAALGIEKEGEENKVAGLTAKSKKAEVEAAEVLLDRRTLRAPFDGVIVEVKKHPGEWVAPGDGVVRMVRVDRLRIHGTVNATQYGPGDVEGRRVSVNVVLPGGKTFKVDGKIVFASPVVDVGGKLPVYAEIDNREDETGHPIVRHGLDATMTIHLNSAPAAAAARTPPRNAAARNN